MRKGKGPGLRLYEVAHPEYPTVQVASIGPDSATVEACAQWGARELWPQLACECRVKCLGTAARPRCRRCVKEYGDAGGVPGLCPDCREAEERYRREVATVRSRDRRERERRNA